LVARFADVQLRTLWAWPAIGADVQPLLRRNGTVGVRIQCETGAIKTGTVVPLLSDQITEAELGIRVAAE
jgi:hypothetical protein